MDQFARVELIKLIERLRDSRVLTYVTSDRPLGNITVGQIADDACRPFYDQLREIGHVPRIDVFVYSRGGALDVPWRLVTALRQATDEWNVLVPYRANSAATLLALGADSIVLGPYGELGPIDPTLTIQRGAGQAEPINVEDVMGYLRFIQERAGLSDQAALASGLALLGQKLDAVVLGSIYRTHSHIRDLARRVLMSRPNPPNEQDMRSIIETLAEKVYAHGHAISGREAGEIGLPVAKVTPEVEDAMWQLLGGYETYMKLRDTLDPHTITETVDQHDEEWITAVIETGTTLHQHRGRVRVTAKRQLPPQLNVPLNLNLSAPVGGSPADLQKFLTDYQQLLTQLAQQAVMQAVAAVAPVTGFDMSIRDAKWERLPMPPTGASPGAASRKKAG